jgi:DNA-binding response OmpR family regulator/CHASE3 domain sensor protein
MNYRTLRLKIITGYAILAIVLVFAAQMVYDSTRSLTALNTASERLMERRNVVDSLVYSMLDAANAERSVMMGDTRQWQRFSTSLSESQRKAMQLKQLVSDSVKAMRMDTLANLLAAKRDNAMMVLNILADASGDAVYARKVHDLQSGRDSVVIHPNEITSANNRETVYNIVSTRRGFFRRLGDAFRRQRSDTIATTMQSGRTDSTAMAQGINIADSVAEALADIHHEIKRADTRRQDAIDNRTRSLKLVSIQLAWRTGQMLEDIQSDEHNAMQRAIKADMQARRSTMMKIAMLALLAIGAAIVLIVYTLRDIRRQRRDHERIVEAKNETERLMQQRQRLLLTITHDIAAFIGGQLAGDYSVAYATNGNDGLQKTKDIVPDIIITDIMMPGMDGLELCRKIRSNKAINHIPIIIVTAKVSEQERIEEFEAGADAYLTKPFSMDELRTIIEQLINRQNSLRNKFSEKTTSNKKEEKEMELTDAERRFLAKTVDYIYLLLDKQQLDVNTLAEKLCMSSRQFHRKIVTLTGNSPATFILKIKMKRARYLLETNSKLNADEIAFRCGFEHTSSFYHAFRKTYGYTPKEIRRGV